MEWLRIILGSNLSVFKQDPDLYKEVILEHEMYEVKREQVKEAELEEKNKSKIDDEFRDSGNGENQT